MSSSTSSSEGLAWKRFTVTLVSVAALVLAVVMTVIYLTDPYDTGRSQLIGKTGVRPQGPRTAAASRGRDPTFNGAIFGNSHLQLLSPERLKASTGIDFVQLTVPASRPLEQLTLLDWFMRHRTTPPKAIVIGADDGWCTADPALPVSSPFPFWLFSESTFEYLRGLLRYDLLEEVPRRLGFVFSRDAERARPDGYWDYEPNYIGLGYDSDPVLRRRLEQKPHEAAPRFDRDPVSDRQFPAAGRLRDLSARLPAEAALVVIFPPNYTNFMPPVGTEAAYRDAACKAAIRAAIEGRPGAAVIDWRVDRPENRDERLFFDMTHYRQPIARLIEDNIAKALNRVK